MREFRVEKYIASGFAFHPMNPFSQWEKVFEKDFEHESIAKDKVFEIAKKEGGKYRVINTTNGKVVFEIYQKI